MSSIPAAADRYLDRAADQLARARNAPPGYYRERYESRAADNISRANAAIAAGRRG